MQAAAGPGWHGRVILDYLLMFVNNHTQSARSTSRLATLSHLRTCAILCLLCAPLLVPDVLSGQQRKATGAFDDLAQRAGSAKDGDRLDEAVDLYRHALALRPKWAEGWWSLGTIEYDRNDYAAAADDFKKLIPLAPKDGNARVMLGLCEFELDQDAAALKDLRAGRALGVTNDPQLQEVVFYHEGILLLRSGRFKVAQTTFGTLCKMNIRSDQVMEGMGMAMLRIPPKELPPPGSTGSVIVQRVGNAACLTAMKNFDDASVAYTQLLDLAPAFPNIHYAFGLSLLEASNIPKAVEQFKAEIEQNPKNVAARLEIAASFYKVDSSAGLPYAQEAVNLSPQQPFAHYLLGLLLLDTNQYQKAIPELETAAMAFPKEKRVFFALGSAYARAGRSQDAEKARATFAQLNKESQSDAATSY
jgi:tetratricopeptide (TPR) repeat protein